MSMQFEIGLASSGVVAHSKENYFTASRIGRVVPAKDDWSLLQMIRNDSYDSEFSESAF